MEPARDGPFTMRCAMRRGAARAGNLSRVATRALLGTLLILPWAAAGQWLAVAEHMGKPVQGAVDVFGPRYATSADDQGRGTWYRWVYEGVRLAPPSREPPTPQVGADLTIAMVPGALRPPRLIIERCVLELLADPAGDVVSYRTEGVGCAEVAAWPELWREGVLDPADAGSDRGSTRSE